MLNPSKALSRSIEAEDGRQVIVDCRFKSFTTMTSTRPSVLFAILINSGQIDVTFCFKTLCANWFVGCALIKSSHSERFFSSYLVSSRNKEKQRIPNRKA